MQKAVSRGFSTMSLSLEGGGAKGLLYAGVLKAIQQDPKKPNVQAAIGASAGSLGSTLIGLNIPADDLINYMDPNSTTKPTGIIPLPHVQDYLPKHIRESQYSINLSKIQLVDSQLTKDQVNGVCNYIASFLCDKESREQALAKDKDIFGEIIVGGSFIAGYNLVVLIEDILNKYLPDSIKGESERRNCTFKKYKEATGVDLAMVGSDIKAGIPRVFSAKSSPDLPVKYGVRISSSIPFYMPIVYWQKKWGTYLGQDITGHGFIDGGFSWNQPLSLLASVPELQSQFFSQKIDTDSVVGFHFGPKQLQKPVNMIDALKGDVPADLQDPQMREYLVAVRKNKEWSDYDIFTVPGLQAFLGFLSTINGLSTLFPVEVWAKRMGVLNAGGINGLDFGLNGVDVKLQVQNAQDVAANLFKKLNL